MYSRKLALRLARQYRTCPPAEFWNDPSVREQLAQHKELCPYCSAGSVSDENPWAAFGKELATLFPEPKVRSGGGRPQPGQLRFVRRELAAWRDGLYYNPPLVLVLDAATVGADDVLMAQTYHDICLAAPGDFVLTERNGALKELLVECWNTYTLEAANLGPSVASLSQEQMDAVKALGSDPNAYPAWALRPLPLTKQDPRTYFRRLEVEVGYTFSARAVGELVAALEAAPLPLHYPSVADLMAAVRQIISGVTWPMGPPKKLEQVLPLARFPVERLPLAAKDEHEAYIWAKRVEVRQGRIASLRPVRVRILDRRFERAGRLVVSGRVEELSNDSTEKTLVCLWVTVEGQIRAPEGLDWDEATGYFAVVFDVDDPAAGRLEIALLCESTEG